VTLGKLAPGEWRPLAQKEVDIINALARTPRQGKNGTP